MWVEILTVAETKTETMDNYCGKHQIGNVLINNGQYVIKFLNWVKLRSKFSGEEIWI